MTTLRPKKIFIENGVEKLPVAQEIIELLPDVPIEYINDYRKIRVSGNTIDSIYERTKEYLVLARKIGDMVKELAAKVGENIRVVRFNRLEVGE